MNINIWREDFMYTTYNKSYEKKKKKPAIKVGKRLYWASVAINNELSFNP
ncbi:hypothetical protein Sjap_023074 [Stephania japonica]|uniref:Uncharacterized protein n=1 Tax=Stephania japonica TaxID=461633 RepID=A0AAP0EVG9_9MAGN